MDWTAVEVCVMVLEWMDKLHLCRWSFVQLSHKWIVAGDV